MYNTTQQQWPVVSVSGASVWSGPGSCWIFAVPDTVHQPPPGSMNVRTRVYSGITDTAAPRLPPRPAGYLPVQRRGLQHPRGRRFFRKRFAGRCDTIQSIQSIHLHCHTVATLRTSHFTHNASNNKLRCHTSHRTLQLQTCYTGLGSVTSLMSRSAGCVTRTLISAQNECCEPPSLQ